MSEPINVFSREFLKFAASREPVPRSTHEASFAGPFRVEPLGNEFAVVREIDGEPEAITQHYDIALMIAAVLPATGRHSRYWCCLEQAEIGEKIHALQTINGPGGPATVGQLKSPNEDLPFFLDLLDHILRSPAALAFLIEAASAEALHQTGVILAKSLNRLPKTRFVGADK